MLALILSPKTVPKCPRIGQTTCFRSNWVFREVTPVSHISLKTDRMILQRAVLENDPKQG